MTAAARRRPLALAAQPAPQPDQALQQRAARLWPDSPALQAEWLRAVAVVRSTRRGWPLDRPLGRQVQP